MGLLLVQKVSESPVSLVRLCLAALQAATSLFFYPYFWFWKGVIRFYLLIRNPLFQWYLSLLFLILVIHLNFWLCFYPLFFLPVHECSFSLWLYSVRRGRKSLAAVGVLPSAFSLQIKCSLISNLNLLLSNCHLNQKLSVSPFLSFMLAGLKVNYSEFYLLGWEHSCSIYFQKQSAVKWVTDLHPGLLLQCRGRASLPQLRDLFGFTGEIFKYLLCSRQSLLPSYIPHLCCHTEWRFTHRNAPQPMGVCLEGAAWHHSLPECHVDLLTGKWGCFAIAELFGMWYSSALLSLPFPASLQGVFLCWKGNWSCNCSLMCRAGAQEQQKCPLQCPHVTSMFILNTHLRMAESKEIQLAVLYIFLI